jgi:hypothetical protein
MAAVKMIVDMPNARASLLTRFVLQNQGTLSAKKRRQFPESLDEEIIAIESEIWRAVTVKQFPFAIRIVKHFEAYEAAFGR